MEAHVRKMLVAAQRESPSSHDVRLEYLNRLEHMVLDHQDQIVAAINQDFDGRGEAYCTLGDVWAGLNTLREVKSHLKDWMEPEHLSLGFTRFPFNLMGSATIYKKPLGVVLILSPWNYPFHIPISALADVLGAGNRAVIKPSESTPKTSALLQQLISQTFDPLQVSVYTGGPDCAIQLTSLPFDHILHVGSTHVGRHVMRAAAANLTPVTLELGGKNPCIVCPDYDLAAAAATVVSQKMENSGQVCTGVDTVFVPRGQAGAFVQHMKAHLVEKWGEGALGRHEQCCSLIHDEHFQRCKSMLCDAENKAPLVVSLDPTGCRQFEGCGRKFPPHAIINPPPDALCSQEEIFGPLCVLREYDEIDDVVEYVNSHPCPLACYVLTHSNASKCSLTQSIRCGGMGINCINLHTCVAALPFGGVGASGTGCYHGKEGFMNFSHRMACYEFKRKVLPNIHLPYSESDVVTIKSYCKPPPNVALALKVVGVGVGAAVLWRFPWRPTLLGLAKWVIETLEPNQ